MENQLNFEVVSDEELMNVSGGARSSQVNAGKFIGGVAVGAFFGGLSGGPAGAVMGALAGGYGSMFS
jgi:Bacteriocin class II with double-glycine leader peptide.